MSKLLRAAQTSQSLSLAAMEEASRRGLREADIDHLFLALVLSDQAAGRALRGLGIDIASARRAVEDHHEANLAALGVQTSFPQPGRIVFHETDGYEWTTRATDLIARSGGKGKEGDAAAVLRELLAEPSGLIADILDRLGTNAAAVLEVLDTPATQTETPRRPSRSGRAAVRGQISGSTETFVPAPVEEVWSFLADPGRMPEWDIALDSVDVDGREVRPGSVWRGTTVTERPDGRPVKRSAAFRRRDIRLIALERPTRVEWSSTYPDAEHSKPVRTAFSLAPTPGGTQVTVEMSWTRRGGWRRLVGLPLRPLQKFVVWISVFQVGSAISRAFR